MGKVQRSRIAFAAAYLALVVGLFIALGGTAYAQSSPTSDQYGDKSEVVTVNDPESTVAGVAVTETSGSQALPNTGLSLLGTAVVGGGLVGLGIMLRRRERKNDV